MPLPSRIMTEPLEDYKVSKFLCKKNKNNNNKKNSCKVIPKPENSNWERHSTNNNKTHVESAI